MRYELKIPAIHGDVIPLCLVAETMARAASTAYGKTPPHKPIFNYQLPTQTKHLLNEARAGRLHVCNQDGVQGAADEIIAAAKSSGDISEVRRYLVEPDWEKLHRDNPPVIEGVGVWDFSGIDLGATEIDWDTTSILILYSKLHCLIEGRILFGQAQRVRGGWSLYDPATQAKANTGAFSRARKPGYPFQARAFALGRCATDLWPPYRPPLA